MTEYEMASFYLRKAGRLADCCQEALRELRNAQAHDKDDNGPAAIACWRLALDHLKRGCDIEEYYVLPRKEPELVNGERS